METYIVEKLSGVFGKPDFPEGKDSMPLT